MRPLHGLQLYRSGVQVAALLQQAYGETCFNPVSNGVEKYSFPREGTVTVYLRDGSMPHREEIVNLIEKALDETPSHLLIRAEVPEGSNNYVQYLCPVNGLVHVVVPLVPGYLQNQVRSAIRLKLHKPDSEGRVRFPIASISFKQHSFTEHIIVLAVSVDDLASMQPVNT